MIRALKKKGYRPTDQTSSHVILRHPDGGRIKVLGYDPLGKGLLMEIISEAGISRSEFLELLWLRILANPRVRPSIFGSKDSTELPPPNCYILETSFIPIQRKKKKDGTNPNY